MSERRQQKTSLAVAVFLLILLLAAPSFGAEYVSVGRDGVNMRSGPSTSNEILWEVFSGFPLQVLSRQGQWLHTVDFEGDRGWIYTPLINTKKTVIVKVKLANMRSGPGTNFETSARVKYGVVFEPMAKEGEWVRVRHEDGTTGWMHQDLLWP
jgi:SH3-like domain-containing protein